MTCLLSALLIWSPYFPLFTPYGSALSVSLQFPKYANIFHISQGFGQADALARNTHIAHSSFLVHLQNSCSIFKIFMNITPDDNVHLSMTIVTHKHRGLHLHWHFSLGGVVYNMRRGPTVPWEMSYSSLFQCFKLCLTQNMCSMHVGWINDTWTNMEND